MNKIKSFLPKVSACLLAYERPDNIRIIVKQLLEYEFVDEITIWNNNSKRSYQFESKKVKLVNSSKNRICYGRFLCAKMASSEILYVQDDDVIVNNIEQLFREFLKNPSRITHALSHNHFEKRHIYEHYFGSEALLG